MGARTFALPRPSTPPTTGLHQLVSMLDDRLGGSWLQSRTDRARHQTLAATIWRSYDLLTPALQSALKRLAVFAGGFTLEAAAVVAGEAGTSAATIAALAERSLITAGRLPGRVGAVPGRYTMLETIRQYCTRRADDEDDPGGQAAARDAHARYFAALTRQASAELTGWQQGRWLTRLQADHANLTTALN